MITTLSAMKRIEEIRLRREERFKLLRFKGTKLLKKQEALKEIEKGIDFVISPVARKKQELAQSQEIRTAESSEKAASNKN